MLEENLAALPAAIRAALGAGAALGQPISGVEDGAAPSEALVDRLFEKGDVPLLVVIGAGLGHLLEAVERRSPSTKVLAIESAPAETARMLARRDWRDWITSGRLMLLVGPDYVGASDAFRFFPKNVTAPPVLITPAFTQQFGALATVEARAVARRVIAGVRANEEARREFAGRYLLNTLNNLPEISSEGDAAGLFGAFAGVPAIVIGAGPSLDRNVEHLRTLQERALLIAVDTAVRPLLAADVRPHIVVSVDPTDINARHLNALPDTRGMWLAAEGSIDPRVFPQFTDRTFTFKVSNHQPWPWLAQHDADRGTLQAWGSVITTAFDLALRAGCDPIVFAGADLAYSRGLQYCRNTVYEPEWSQFPTDEERAAVWAIALETRPHLTDRDVAGADVTTAPPFIQFRDWLVSQAVSARPRRIVNATGAGILHGGGIEIRDLESLTLPSRANAGGDLRQRLRTLWETSTAANTGPQERLAGALAYGEAIPLTEWLDFGGDTATREQIVATAKSVAERIASAGRKRAYLARQRDFYDRRILTVEDARELSHVGYEVGERRAAAQQAPVLIDFLQRCYEVAQPGLANTLHAISRVPREIRALDVGCGVGRLMEPLANAGLRVDGVDISKRMIYFAQQNKALTSSEFFLSSGNDCGAAPDGAYDLVYSQLCFRYICSRSVRNDLLRAMARALRPGGVVFVEMRFFPNDRVSSIQAPNVPWSADQFESVAEGADALVWATPDEFHLVQQDFSRYFADLRLQFVDQPMTFRDREPPYLFVSGSTTAGLASRIHVDSTPSKKQTSTQGADDTKTFVPLPRRT